MLTETKTFKTISFALRSEETVTNTTVRVVIDIEALVTSDVSESALRNSIGESLTGLIATEWQFANLRRAPAAGAYETVHLSASARVGEADIVNLEARTAAAKTDRLTLTLVETDTTIPDSMIVEAESRLRLALLATASREQAQISSATGEPYEVHAVVFGRIENATASRASRASMRKGGMETFASTALSGGGGAEDGYGNTQKYALTAQVTLAA